MRKNILIFGHAFATQFIDISNQYTRLFNKNKYEVTVVYLVDKPNEEVIQRHIAEHVIFLNSPGNSIRHLKIFAIKKLLQLQREKKFQIVICHRYKPSYVMLWVAKFYKIPVLIFVMHELKTMRNITRRLLMAALWQNNMYLAGVSNAVKNDLQNTVWRIPKDRIITLYNAIDVQAIESKILTQMAARTQLNLPLDVFIFGAIGRLVAAKDHTTLIDAFAIIKPNCPGAKLVIMGKGDLGPLLKEKILSLNLVEDILLLGYVPKAFSLIKAFNLFILSSIKEAFGRVLLEAMLAKVNIIATHINGIPEVMGDTGTLVEPGNASLLAEKMYLYYKMHKQELYHCAEQGYHRAVKEFSTEHFKEIFWQLPLLKSEANS